MLDFFLNLLAEAASLLAEASIYLLFGFFVAGLIHAYFPEERILKYFGERNLRSVFNASLLGIPLPLCSCAVIPTAISLRKSGASRGSTISFLISTPETGVGSIGISFALLDPLMTVFRPVAALITALLAGIGANFLERHAPDEIPTNNSSVDAGGSSCHDGRSRAKSNRTVKPLRRALAYSFGELLDDLAPWLVVGFLAAALIAVLVPEDFFAGTFGQGVWPMILMLLVGIPLYICATASTPIAAALILKGLSPGAALVFLLTGPATNIGSLLLLSKYFERKFLVLYLATIALTSFLLGILLNFIYSAFHLDIRATLGGGAELIPDGLKVGAAVFLALLLHRSLLRTGSYRAIGRYALEKTRWTQKRLLAWAGLILLLIYLSDGFFSVPIGHTGMIVSFGKVVSADLQPGLGYRAPRPFAHTLLVPIDQVRTIAIGYRIAATDVQQRPSSQKQPAKGEKLDVIPRQDVPAESEILAGDENLIDLDLSVYYTIADAFQATYRVEDLEKLLRDLANAQLLRQIASRPVWDGLIGGKDDFVTGLRDGLQQTLNDLGLSVRIHQVNLIYAHAPDAVHSSFRDVASSMEDKYRLINLAQTDSISTLASSRAQFAAKLASAQSDSARRIARASGEAQRFSLLAHSTSKQRNIQEFRLNAEAAESTLAGREKILVLGRGSQALDLILIPKSSDASASLPSEVLERLQKSVGGQ